MARPVSKNSIGSYGSVMRICSQYEEDVDNYSGADLESFHAYYHNFAMLSMLLSIGGVQAAPDLCYMLMLYAVSHPEETDHIPDMPKVKYFFEEMTTTPDLCPTHIKSCHDTLVLKDLMIFVLNTMQSKIRKATKGG